VNGWTDLGFYEKRPGSGVWYHRDKSAKYALRTCENRECGREFMGDRGKDRGRFCSMTCKAQSERQANPSYKARHERIYRARGCASQYPCADCGQPAAEWSQVHGTTGNDPGHYVARCKPCHTTYDGQFGETHASATLTDAQVYGIWASTGATQQEIAELHGTTRETVSAIRTGRKWKHLTQGFRRPRR
jgi:hypothetical protein